MASRPVIRVPPRIEEEELMTFSHHPRHYMQKERMLPQRAQQQQQEQQQSQEQPQQLQQRHHLSGNKLQMEAARPIRNRRQNRGITSPQGAREQSGHTRRPSLVLRPPAGAHYPIQPTPASIRQWSPADASTMPQQDFVQPLLRQLRSRQQSYAPRSMSPEGTPRLRAKLPVNPAKLAYAEQQKRLMYHASSLGFGKPPQASGR
jgi:hypothetical protein